MKYLYRLLEWLKLRYKPTQIYYSNKIQDNINGEINVIKSIGSGKVYVFSNKMSELEKLRAEIGVSKNNRIIIHGYPCLLVIGSKIGKVKERANYKSIPIAEIIKILKKQKCDKVK